MNIYQIRCMIIVVALVLLYGTGLRPRMPEDLAGWRVVVGIWCALVVGSGAILTTVARIFGGNSATVSATLQDWCHEWPVIAAAIAFVAGHIVWPVWKR